MDRITEKINIRRFKQGVLTDMEDFVLVENNVELFLNGKPVSKLMCTGEEHLKELVTGHLFCSGFITSADELVSISNDRAKNTIYAEAKFTNSTKDILKATNASPPVIDYPKVVKVFEEFQDMSPLYKKTGSAHSAALLNYNYEFKYFYEDMGRHNAVDKIIGRGLIDGVEFQNSILVTSSRMPLELVKKAHMAGITAIFSISAPTLQSIEFTRAHGIALLGIFRNDRINIYN